MASTWFFRVEHERESEEYFGEELRTHHLGLLYATWLHRSKIGTRLLGGLGAGPVIGARPESIVGRTSAVRMLRFATVLCCALPTTMLRSSSADNDGGGQRRLEPEVVSV